MNVQLWSRKEFNVNVDIGSVVTYTANEDDVTNLGLSLGGIYAGIVVGTDFDTDWQKLYYKIRLFLLNGTDVTVTVDELKYHAFTTDSYGTFKLVNERELFDK